MRSGVAIAAVVAVLGLEASAHEGAGQWASTRWRESSMPQGFARAVALLPAVLPSCHQGRQLPERKGRHCWALRSAW